MSGRTDSIRKVLSRNDTSETGGHQGGILVPKQEVILSFFPRLHEEEYNPRVVITFRDFLERNWSFAFIHYNNRLFGGTRNEYRLTGMTAFLRSVNARAGDSITLNRDSDGIYSILHSPASGIVYGEGCLHLGSGWKVISISKSVGRSQL